MIDKMWVTVSLLIVYDPINLQRLGAWRVNNEEKKWMKVWMIE
jgi:hypothetical protein